MEYDVVEVDESEDPLVGEVLDGRFRIDAPLSEGGMGKVYLASQMGVDRKVAVKVLRSDIADNETIIKRFLREARTISGFSHPNIVNFIDFGQDSDHQALYLVMELIDGVELGELMEKGRLRADFAIEIASQVCSALSEPHHNDVVHRDLKPANLMLLPLMDGSMQVKVVDFGIANAMQSQTRLTQTGAVCGTPHYMAPEQASGGQVTPATDIYGLGAILFHLITGDVMYDAGSGLQIMFKHVDEPLPDFRDYEGIGELPDRFVELFQRMVAKDPADRPSGVLEIRNELEAIKRESRFGEIRVDPDEPTETVFDHWVMPAGERRGVVGRRPETGGNAAPNQTNEHRAASGSQPGTGARSKAPVAAAGGAAAGSQPGAAAGGDIGYAETMHAPDSSTSGSATAEMVDDSAPGAAGGESRSGDPSTMVDEQSTGGFTLSTRMLVVLAIVMFSLAIVGGVLIVKLTMGQGESAEGERAAAADVQEGAMDASVAQGAASVDAAGDEEAATGRRAAADDVGTDEDVGTEQAAEESVDKPDEARAEAGDSTGGSTDEGEATDEELAAEEPTGGRAAEESTDEPARGSSRGSSPPSGGGEPAGGGAEEPAGGDDSSGGFDFKPVPADDGDQSSDSDDDIKLEPVN
jgi:tRNA A-37 threonylcarbamoyl transferase component Bud32